jgi:succinate-semialdehyde dehydrogenase / glutarate-semialdehyde dehydrogenase
MTEAAVVSSPDLIRLRGLLTATGPGMELVSPVTGQVLGELPTSTAADVEVGAQIAHRAQQEWAARPIEERAGLLLAFHDHLLDRRDYFVDLLQADGKDRLSAVFEVLHVALTARYYGRTARRYLRSERGEGVLPLVTKIERHYLPRGLVGVIAPWNWPLTMALSDGLAALVAGNAIMLKPAHQTPLPALAAVELLRIAGLPADLW